MMIANGATKQRIDGMCSKLRCAATISLIIAFFYGCAGPNFPATRYLRVLDTSTVSIDLINLVLNTAQACGFHRELLETTFVKPSYRYYSLSSITSASKVEYNVILMQNLQKNEILVLELEPNQENNAGFTEGAQTHFNCVEELLNSNSTFKFKRWMG